MAELLIPPYLQFFDENGDPLSGGFIYTYSAGTTAPKPTYTDSTASVELSNPIELDSAGRTVMWGTGSYKFVVTDSLGNTIRTVDNVTTYSTIADEAEPLFDIFSGTGSQTVFTLSEDAGTDSENLMVFVSTPVQSYVTNGNFDTDTDWTKGSGWTIGTGVATATGAISTAISQTSPKTLISGQAYRLTYTVTRSAGGIIPSIGGRNGTERTASGTYTEIIIADSTQTIAFTGNAFTGTIDSVSINNLDTTGYQIQPPNVYTINGTTLSFLTAPPSGTNNIYVLAPSLLLGAASAAVASAEAAEAGALIAQAAAELAETNAETAETNAEAAQLAAEAAQALAEAAADRLTGTSTSSVTIGTGSKAFTTQADKFFEAGNWILITSDADPSNYMHGQVTAYSGTSLTVNVTNIGGSGTLADWTIRLSGTRGAVGATGPAGSVTDGDKGDITVSSSGSVWTIDNSAVTLAKIQDISTRKILGRTTAGTGVTEQLDFIDDDTMATATATNVPSAESVKAYVDTEISGISTGGGLINTIYYTCPSQTVTISNASPAVFTYPNSGRDRPQDGCPVRLTTTGSLPPNFSTGVTYYVVNSSGSTSNLAATKGGAAINAGGAGSGTHTIQNAPYDKTINNPSFVRVTVVGGSGGGSNNASQGGGAGAGGAKKLILNADLGTTETVTSGVAGNASGAPGGTGGTSSFGSHCSATGGTGGTTTPSVGGTGTGGDLNVSGASSMPASTSNAVGATSAFGYSRGGNNAVAGQPGIVEVEEYA